MSKIRSEIRRVVHNRSTIAAVAGPQEGGHWTPPADGSCGVNLNQVEVWKCIEGSMCNIWRFGRRNSNIEWLPFRLQHTFSPLLASELRRPLHTSLKSSSSLLYLTTWEFAPKYETCWLSTVADKMAANTWSMLKLKAPEGHNPEECEISLHILTHHLLR